MLQTLRDKTSGWIATVILGLLIVPFALVGVQDYVVQNADDAAANINAPPTWWQSAPSWWPVSVLWTHEKVTISEFRTRFEQERQQQRTQQGEAFDAKAFESIENKRAIMEVLIDQKLQGMASNEAGVVVSDKQVRNAIESVPAFQVDGKFNTDRYQLALASQVPPQTPRQFDDMVRASLRQSMVAAGVGSSNFVTQAELDRLIRLLGEQRDASMLTLPMPAADTAPVTDAEIKGWYDGHAAAFRAPESVSIEYVELNSAAMPLPPAADEATLRQRYEQEKKRYAAQEERMASHILVRVDADANAATQKTAEQKAAQFAQQAKAPGADFAALARANSDDTGSKSTGGDLGWVSKGMMVAPFEAALFAMKPGEVSGPVKTEFGWHVIQLREIKAGAQEPFEQVRDALAREQAEADRERAFNELSSRMVDLVYKNPSSLAPAAREVNLPVLKAGPFSRNSADGIAANAAVKRAAFSETLIQDGTVSDPIEIAPGHSVLIRVTSHTRESARPLAQVREQVIAAVRADRAAKVAEKEGDALLARLRGGETLEAIAASRQLPAPQVMMAIPRGAPVPEAGVSEAVFAAAVPVAGTVTPGKASLADGRVVLFTVSKVSPGDASNINPAQRDMLRQQIGMARGADDVKAMTSVLRKRVKVKVVEENL